MGGVAHGIRRGRQAGRQDLRHDAAARRPAPHPFDTAAARQAFYRLAPGAVRIPAPVAHLKLYDMSGFLAQRHPFDVGGAGGFFPPFFDLLTRPPPVRLTETRARRPRPAPPSSRIGPPVSPVRQAPGEPVPPAQVRLPDEVPLRQGFYLQAGAGIDVVADATNRSNLIDIESEFDTGTQFNGAIGYALGNGFRFEGELGYRIAGLDSLTVTKAGNISGLSIGPFSADGDVSSLSLMANAAFDMRLDMPFIPYFLLGAGVALVTMDDVRLNSVKVADDSAWVMAFQVGAGAVIDINESWALDVALRAFFANDQDLKDAAGGSFDTEFESYSLTVGTRYRF